MSTLTFKTVINGQFVRTMPKCQTIKLTVKWHWKCQKNVKVPKQISLLKVPKLTSMAVKMLVGKPDFMQSESAEPAVCPAAHSRVVLYSKDLTHCIIYVAVTSADSHKVSSVHVSVCCLWCWQASDNQCIECSWAANHFSQRMDGWFF